MFIALAVSTTLDLEVAMRLLGISTAAALLLSACPSYAGPCSAQLVQLKKLISANDQDGFEGPTAPQTVGAQLGRQPTPSTVDSAEHEASALVQDALNRIRRANDAGDAAACRKAVAKFKDLYGLE
jgi:hypothetical protein